MKLFHVRSATRHVLINIPDGLMGDEREYVKREARRYLFDDPDRYIVDPISDHGDAIFLSLSIGDLRL